jgi:outer membrane lipoprotein LolB
LRPLCLRCAVLCLVSVLLAACSSLPPIAATIRPPRPAITAFDIEARLSIRNDQQIHVAHVSWQHRSGSDQVLVTGPLGQGVAELQRDAGGAQLRMADRGVLMAEDWKTLGEKLFGMALPLDDIPRWITGDIGNATQDGQGRPRHADAAGWHIDYAEYESDALDALPTLIVIGRGDITVKLKVDQWTLP